LSDRAKTSHSALAAYEAGRKQPRVDTFDRIVRATGHELRVELGRRILDSARGHELAEALELASQFPTRHASTLTCPRFGPRRPQRGAET
jgi:transcriptional regulator with XRE-family HTH domain